MADEQATASKADIKEPPKTIGGILRQLGPGLIIAASIVGSGELVATTAVGAQAGFVLMWVIIIGCVIKVFTQIEFGRYAITHGRTSLDGMNEVPGPRLKANWILWAWAFSHILALIQVGGIVGGVSQAISISKPLTTAGAEFNERQDLEVRLEVNGGLITRFGGEVPDAVDDLTKPTVPSTGSDPDKVKELLAERAELQEQLAAMPAAAEADTFVSRLTRDDVIWGAIITAITIVMLVVGRYRLVQSVSMFLVASFTVMTICTLVYLQTLPDWRISWTELASGLTFQFPTEGEGLLTALAAFGIIGVGATELIQYPYWCLEAGYAKWTGPVDDSDEWRDRARGWLRVLYWDAWCSMIVYTFATIAFYLLGATVLGRCGLVHAKDHMVRTLSEMYVPVFGEHAQTIFLLGAFAVLYSTFFVAAASHARVTADSLRVFGLSSGTERSKRRWVTFFCAFLPLFMLLSYIVKPDAKGLVLAGGLSGALLLPLLGLSALYFRYRRCDARLTPGKLWDALLWLSFLGLAIVGGFTAYKLLFT